ncbi:probable DNA topoisomerase 1 [Cephalotrichum gorgonifer]|uniref:DNA topoisomerase I n=1 Tax=Cephalotrichum gorgonifer TaxID=2041049 RepID=A0AAE8SQS8_9PEZI|nr:probable DNA topoisomerase 1 [Cephalotrichum gorgonifer]
MSSESDDDMPLARNGRVDRASVVPPVDDPYPADFKPLRAGSASNTRNDAMDLDGPATNGVAKRKSRSSITNVSYKDDSDDSEDGQPLAKRQRTRTIVSDDDSDDAPLRKTAKKSSSTPAKAKKPPVKKAVKDETDSEDDVPLAKPAAKRRSLGTPASSKKTNGVKKADSDSDVPMKKVAPKKAAPKKAAPAASAKGATSKAKAAAVKKDASEAPEEEEEEFEWWNAPKNEDDSIKWTTLEHNGVLFPPEYTPLPARVKLLYDGTPVKLHPEAEEVAWFFGSMLHSSHNVDNPVFQKNFFADFKETIKNTGGATDKQGNKIDIKEFSKLDFTKIHEYWSQQNEAKKARPAAEKKAEKAEKDKVEAPFMYCKWDGRKEKVGNFRVEPPSLFRGRGEHPKTGKVKRRVTPEQITINIGKGAEVPKPPPGHKWKAVQHDNKATWLAMWQENINGAYKYVMLAANSAIKGQSDFKKFEKARELKKHIDKIRRDYTRDLKSDVMADRQRATAVYLIDKLALRAGNEKDAENEAETVGCCSLKYEHVTLREPNTLIFDFLGKDSIRYYDEVQVEKQVFKNFKHFKKAPKSRGDDIFDRLTTSQLNKHLSGYMPGLTAKVFRTYNASITMSRLLQGLKADDRPIAEKVKLYNDCNREVAILCNHKRTVGAGHEGQMEKLVDKIKGYQYKQWRAKQMILDLDPKQKKKKGADWFALDPELTEEWLIEHQAQLVEKEREAIQKKFQKENEKREAEGEKPMPEKDLKERLKAANELAAKYKKENKSKKVVAEGRGVTVEKLETQIAKLDVQIANTKLQAEDREGNKEVALSTSKLNYIDPRLTVVFARKFDVPIEKFFSKTLREKFNWAIKSVEDSEWEF